MKYLVLGAVLILLISVSGCITPTPGLTGQYKIMISEVYYTALENVDNFIEIHIYDDGGNSNIDLSGW